ncbi:RNA-binding S4 domain-containing protein [Desulfoluna butyratoxydans]|uniref:S4 domain n=1 Tax=Desulfoluna butyratoxydans TaxID=231438 RepID=A0A4U8YL62_9BACT|nr:RNA-binding S4 domain-containing protein [Desulfoluna butyratoxydans]VFQ44144.1 s4 domain [Desulfoluna butyratoxydans]
MTETITIRQEPIELYKVLKIANWVGAGGEAKFVISEGLVELNGEVETRKAKKVYNNDVVTFQEMSVKVVVGETPEE